MRTVVKDTSGGSLRMKQGNLCEHPQHNDWYTQKQERFLIFIYCHWKYHVQSTKDSKNVDFVFKYHMYV